jgi:aminoglycoside phosphotransferase (APT) family kinase protein
MAAQDSGAQASLACADAVARRFLGDGAPARLERHLQGHIHDTWLVEANGSGPAARGLVLQQLNERVFPDVALMMGNVERVARHLKCPEVVVTADGEALIHDGHCRPWRAFERVRGATSHDTIATPGAAGEIGRAYGRFLVAVDDLTGGPPAEPIPGFKDFPRRVAEFEFFVDLDPFDRAASCRSEIEAVRAHGDIVGRLTAALEAGQLESRTVHNDAKASNVLLDDATGEAVCVVDLDTVAVGTVLFDIGDMLRSVTVTSAEDASDPSAVVVRDDLLEAALSGYLAEAGSLLTAGERALIPLAGPLMAYENATRFLTDHLAGDLYYRTTRPRHNLDRARAQLRVLQVLESAADRVAALAARG